jgi:hypothetical protein
MEVAPTAFDPLPAMQLVSQQRTSEDLLSLLKTH